MKFEKGKGYFGRVGVGKTYLMRNDYEKKEPRGLKRWYTSLELAAIAQQHGLEALLDKVNCTHLYIDDIGRERSTITKHWTVIKVMEDFIAARYDFVRHKNDWLPIDGFYTTHFTTNLSLDEMNQRYGEYIPDRLLEMCKFQKIEGDSKRQ